MSCYRCCPECRTHSDFVVPSEVWVEDKEEKVILFEMYFQNTKKKPCKYFQVSEDAVE